jgi:hypothetical protein
MFKIFWMIIILAFFLPWHCTPSYVSSDENGIGSEVGETWLGNQLYFRKQLMWNDFSAAFAPTNQGQPVTATERSKACTVFALSEAGIVSLNPTQVMYIRWCMCLGRGLVMSWSPIQGVLPSVNWSWNWEISPVLQSGSKRRDKKKRGHVLMKDIDSCIRNPTLFSWEKGMSTITAPTCPVLSFEKLS